VTLIYALFIDTWKMYLHTENEASRSRLLKDIQTCFSARVTLTLT